MEMSIADFDKYLELFFISIKRFRTESPTAGLKGRQSGQLFRNASGATMIRSSERAAVFPDSSSSVSGCRFENGAASQCSPVPICKLLKNPTCNYP